VQIVKATALPFHADMSINQAILADDLLTLERGLAVRPRTMIGVSLPSYKVSAIILSVS
jgi:hypothetical protein